MQRAIGVLRRRMWDGKGMTRWTLEGCMLPASLKEVLLLHLLLEVTNEFREVAHQEVILVPFEVRGYHLHPLEHDLSARLEPLPRTPLAQQELNTWTEAARDQWHEHQRQIRTLITERRDKYRQEFAQRMRQRLQEEVRAETTIFQERLRELERQKQPRYLEALQKEIEKQCKRLLQPALFTEIQQAEQQHLHQLEWDLAHTYIERMKALVLGEQKRILEQVLPRRYTLATVDLQPLAIEYIVRSTGNAGKEQH